MMKRNYLVRILFVVIVLFCLDRTVAHLYKPHADSKDVVIYTTEWCPYCNSLRIHLNNYDVIFTERDIEKSISGIAGFWALRARGVPVSVVGPEVVYGYDIDKINQSLVNLGYSSSLLEDD